jgi:hypothetical protein
MIADTKPLAEVTQEAINILLREIGVINTVRFLNQYTAGYGNYTEEREQLFESMTLDNIITEIKKGRETSDA